MLISASFLSLKDKKKIKELSNENIDYLHLDIMDGRYVRKRTMPFFRLKKYLKDVNKPLDVHLMVKNVFKYVKKYEQLNPEYITFHLDTKGNHGEIISYLKQKNIKVGIALKPEEDVSILYPYLDDIDLVLIMSVEPGKGGQDFMPEVLPKINKLNEHYMTVSIDGGINDKTIEKCRDCDMVVVGSFITNGDFKDKIENLRNVIDKKGKK